MRFLLFPACILMFISTAFAQTGNIGFGTLHPDSSAMLDITSNSKGLLIPRMTSLERATITNPSKGLMVFDSTTVSFWYFNGGSWQQLVPEPPPIPSDILYSQLDQAGIAGQAETTISNWLMPANTLTLAGESIEVHAFGENMADTSVIRFKMGNNVLEFPIERAGKWDAQISLFYKSANEIKIAGTLNISGLPISNVIAGSIDFTLDTPFLVTAQQNQALINGVGMEGIVISRHK